MSTIMPQLLYLCPRENDGTHWIRVWVGPRDDLDILEKKNILHLSGFKFKVVQSLASEQWIGFKSHSDHPFRMWTRKCSKFMYLYTGSRDTHLFSWTSPTLDGKWPSDLKFHLFSPFITFMASISRNQTNRSFAYRIQRFIKKNSTRCNNVSKFCYSIFIWSSTCFGRHSAHHQEPKTALAASGFSYVEGCWTCSWWTLSGTVWEGALHNVHQLHVQQPSTYEKPEAASAVLGSW